MLNVWGVSYADSTHCRCLAIHHSTNLMFAVTTVLQAKE
jgi:hypothetical protein